jgi:site-specific recombinase XerD
MSATLSGQIVTRERAEVALAGTDFITLLLETRLDGRGRTTGVRLSMRHHETWRRVAQLLDDDQDAQRTAAWLLRAKIRSVATRDAYLDDLSRWLTWCASKRLDPHSIPYEEADAFQAELEFTPKTRGTGNLSAATRARICAAVSSWYRVMVRAGLATSNPFEGADRPQVSRRPGASMGADDARAFVARVFATREDGMPVESLRTRALVAVMVACAFRVTSTLDIDVDMLGYDRGHRIIDSTVKGGKGVRHVLPPEAARHVDAYLAERGNPTSGPLFVTAGGLRLDRVAVYRLIKRLSLASGLPYALSPHGVRRTAGTRAVDRNVPINRVKEFLNHAALTTTQAYVEAAEDLDQDAGLVVARDLLSGT